MSHQTMADHPPRPRRATTAAAVIRDSELPERLGALVLAVTGKCRLWASERADIARELCAHFRDGLEAGASSDDLAATFGDPARAAKLITAARKRLRPLWWRASRASLRAAGAFLLVCIVTYAVLAARFYVGSPNIARNIMDELNTPVVATPLDQRAWPLYIEAKRQFGVTPDFMNEREFESPTAPGDRYWPQMSEWIDANQDAFETLRRAASRPALGYVYSDRVDPDLSRALAQTVPGYAHEPDVESPHENPLVVGILLPHLGEMRRFARHLRADVHLAVSRGDPERYLADINAMLRMAEQTLDEKFLISNLVGMSIGDLVFTTVLKTAFADGLMSDEQLRDLAHSLGGFGGGRVRVDPSNELFMVDDLLQRFFSDDGRGDGRYIGGPGLEDLYEEWGVARPRAEPLLKAFRPVRAAFVSSRAEIRDRAARFVAAGAADDLLPPWRHDERNSDEAYRELVATGIFTVVPFLRSVMNESESGPLKQACASRDLMETRREASITVLAMEAYRRSRGSWPETLVELVPQYMPRVPLDPFDGQPLRYIAAQDEGSLPRLYSVGVDQVDDGGVAPETESGHFAVRNFLWFKVDPKTVDTYGAGPEYQTVPRGDWVLWPP